MPDDKPVTRRGVEPERANRPHLDVNTDTDRKSSDNPADDTGHPVQPAGQATSPESNADALRHQRTGEPDVDPNADESDEPDTQRMSLTLPRSTTERIRAHADTNDMTVSDAAADLLKAPSGGGPDFHQSY